MDIDTHILSLLLHSTTGNGEMNFRPFLGVSLHCFRVVGCHIQAGSRSVLNRPSPRSRHRIWGGKLILDPSLEAFSHHVIPGKS